jgi:hypothetical protein
LLLLIGGGGASFSKLRNSPVETLLLSPGDISSGLSEVAFVVSIVDKDSLLIRSARDADADAGLVLIGVGGGVDEGS